MSNIFDKNEPEDVEVKSVSFDIVDQPIIESVEEPAQTVESMINKIKELDVSSGEKLVFDNVSPIEFNAVYKAFNKQSMKPKYNHGSSQLFFP